jgi:hypothetical protein
MVDTSNGKLAALGLTCFNNAHRGHWFHAVREKILLARKTVSRVVSPQPRLSNGTD